MNLPFFIQFAGVLQLVIAAANFFLPAKLHYRENLAKVTPIIRQIFTVHCLYIVLVLVGFSLLCLFFPRELCGASAVGTQPQRLPRLLLGLARPRSTFLLRPRHQTGQSRLRLLLCLRFPHPRRHFRARHLPHDMNLFPQTP